MERVFGRFFRRFNRGFDKAGSGYQRALGHTLRRSGIAKTDRGDDAQRKQGRDDHQHNQLGA